MVHIKIMMKENNLGYHFNVEVVDTNGSISNHRVTMDRDFVTRIGAVYKPEKVIEKSFEFLLSKEQKESILAEFDVTTISQHFPDYISTLEKLLQNEPSRDI